MTFIHRKKAQGWRQAMRRACWLGSMVVLGACQTSDGGNFLLQDFANYGRNYRPIETHFLTTGDSEAQVRAQITASHDVIRDKQINGRRVTTWRYEKWRGQLEADRLEHLVFLHFVDGELVNWNFNDDVSQAFAVARGGLAPPQPASSVASSPPVQQPTTAPATLTVAERAQLSKVATTTVRRGQAHALLIGINDYRHVTPLKTAENDARVLGRILREEYGFKTQVLLNPTRRRTLDAIDGYRKVLKEGDDFLIYYAGHGFLDVGAERGYWLPVDARPDSRSDWLSNSDITDTLRAIKSRHVMVIADSCYSGTLTRSTPGRPQLDARTEDFINRLWSKKSRTVLASGSLEPVLDGGGGGHSVFARVLINVLQDNTTAIDGTTLYALVRNAVALNAEQIPQYQNIRFAGHEVGGDFVFIRK